MMRWTEAHNAVSSFVGCFALIIIAALLVPQPKPTPREVPNVAAEIDLAIMPRLERSVRIVEAARALRLAELRVATAETPRARYRARAAWIQASLDLRAATVEPRLPGR